MTPLQVDAILFDMDGTLIDESRSYREAIRLTAEYLLKSPVEPVEVEEIKRLPGFNNDWDATWALVRMRSDGHIPAPAAINRRLPAYRQLQSIFGTYYLGDKAWTDITGEPAPFEWDEPLMARETPLITSGTLDKLSAFRLGIATSRPRVEAMMALEQHGLRRYFPEIAIVAADDARHEKPHPDQLIRLVRLIGCSSPVYVGDTINDALAAAAAGMPFLYIGADDLDGAAPVYGHLISVNEVVDVCELAGVHP